MTSKNFLSNKKNIKISFSTSPALMDWIKRYVNKQRSNQPNDERYRSISSFIHYSLENLMKIFEKEKSLDDFDRFLDRTLEDFYDQITFKAIIPHFEEALEMNRYINLSGGLVSFYRGFRKTFTDGLSFEELIDDFDHFSSIIIKRFNNFIKQNKITRSLTIERDKDLFIIEYIGNYKNLHFELCKAVAAIAGAVGLKIINSSYMADNSIRFFYMRFDCKADVILTENIPNLKQQKQLGLENLKTMIKYEHILDDKSEHVWLNTSQFNGAIISFSDIQEGVEYIRSKIKELEKTVDPNALSYYILRIFEHFHWLTIDKKDPLSFHYIISKDEHEIEHSIMEEILTKFIDINMKNNNQVVIK